MPDQPLIFKYKNWQGEVGVRRVIPKQIWYGKTDYHPTEQWLLKGLDLDKNAERDFAVCDILEFIKD